MSSMNWVSLLNAGSYSQTQTGAAFANSTTLTDISAGGNTAGQAFSFLGGSLEIGMQFRVRAVGIVSTTGTPNLTLGLYWGGVAGTALATTGAIAAGTGLANQCWQLNLDMRVDAVGPSGTIHSIGSIIGPHTPVSVLLPQTSATGGAATVNTTVTSILTIGAQWSAAAAGNTITVYQYTVESLSF